MSVMSKIDAPSPPNAVGIWAPRSFCLRAASMAALRKTRLAIDVRGIRRGDSCDGGGSLGKRGASIEKELFADVVRNGVAEPGFLHVHGRYASRVFDAKH